MPSLSRGLADATVYARAAIRQTLRRLGLERIHHPSLADLITSEAIRNIIDVGANDGQYGRYVRNHGFRGRITSFEPVTPVFERLRSYADRDPLWDVCRSAVGSVSGEVEISVAAASVFSSFKPLSAYSSRKFEGAREVGRELVPVLRLDDFLSGHPHLLEDAYLKIDTQGFEKEVLIGCGHAIGHMKAVQMELAVRELYEGQPSMVEMIEWMADRGFHIAMAKENGFDWQAMRLLEIDFVFVRQ